MVKDCPYHKAPFNCLAIDKNHYQCTRERDHDGPHAACGVNEDEHPIVTWE